MRRIKLTTTNDGVLDSPRRQAIRNAMAHNNTLPETFLSSKSDEELLCFVHPIDRVRLATALGLKWGKITSEE